MPKHPPESSTTRRHRLYEFIESFGEAMVQKCATCVKHNRVCKIHVRSGKCSECLRRGQRCDVRVTESEFKRLAAEKDKLRARIKESQLAQDVAIKAYKKALEDLQVARAYKERLRRQIDLINRRAEEAIAVEEKGIKELKQTKLAKVIAFNVSALSVRPNLLLSTQSAFNSLLLNY